MLSLLIKILFPQLPTLFNIPLPYPLILHSMIFELSLGHRFVKIAYLLKLPLLLLELWQLHLLLVLLLIYLVQWLLRLLLCPHHRTLMLFFLKHLSLLFLLTLVDLLLDRFPLSSSFRLNSWSINFSRSSISCLSLRSRSFSSSRFLASHSLRSS